MRRHGHDSAGAIASQHIVAHPDGYPLLREGVDGIGSGEHAAHPLHLALPLSLAAVLRPRNVGRHLFALRIARDAFNHLVLGAQHHEGHPVYRVGSRRENLKAFGLLRRNLPHEKPCGFVDRRRWPVERKPNRRTFRAPYPVALYFFQRVAVLHLLQAVQQPLGIGRDTQAPLPHQFALHRVAPAHAQAVHHLVVREHRAQVWTPVDGCVRKVGQAVVHQQRLPLGLVHGLPTLAADIRPLVVLYQLH